MDGFVEEFMKDKTKELSVATIEEAIAEVTRRCLALPATEMIPDKRAIQVIS